MKYLIGVNVELLEGNLKSVVSRAVWTRGVVNYKEKVCTALMMERQRK